MQNNTLETINDLNVLSKLIPGIKNSDFVNISDSKKTDVIVNIINASLTNGIDLTSSQVILNKFLINIQIEKQLK